MSILRWSPEHESDRFGLVMADEAILSSRETLLKAMLERDPAYEGVFFTSVRTTGVFCRPTCSARKPKPENVEFFRTAGEAMAAGYRPCKRCRPLDLPGETPTWVDSILRDLESDGTMRLSDADLVARGLDPVTVRRWFKTNMGMTFHQFARSRVLGSVFEQLREPSGIDQAAFDSGYESLSGFRHAFKKTFSNAPGEATTRSLLVYKHIPTSLGTMIAMAEERGLVLLEFVDRPALVRQLQDLHDKHGYLIAPGTSRILEQAGDDIAGYLSGHLREFRVPLHTPGTTFEQAVWQELKQIPYGSTTTYQQLAETFGKPGAARAVRTAVGRNRITLVIPCHRIVQPDGSLGGYGGEKARKAHLIRHERETMSRHVHNLNYEMAATSDEERE